MAGKLSQPGCHSNTGTSSRGGRSLVKLEVLLPESNCHRQSGNAKFSLTRMRGSIRKVEKKGLKNGKKMLGRQSSFLQFSSKPVKSSFSTPKDGVDAALRKFKTLWAAKADSLQSPWEVLAQIRDRYPHLLVNKRHMKPGHLPGVVVGQCFSFRAELCLVGLHKHPQAGIDWADVSSDDGNIVSIGLSIVVSGGYEDDVDEGETLTYTGEGGNDVNTKRQNANQKLVGGNMALRNSKILKNSVRVIRGRSDPHSPSGTTYSYDGLYRVVGAKLERGISGFEVFKFRLVREQGQAPLRWHSPVSSPRKISRGFESPVRFRFPA